MVVGGVILYQTTPRHTLQDRNVQCSPPWVLSHRVARWFVNSNPVELPDGTSPTCRCRVAYSHRPRSCYHCRRCYALLPWRCTSETKTDAPSILSRWLWIHLKMLWLFRTVFFLFWPLLLARCRCKEFHILWTVHRDTYTWERPTSCTHFLINLSQLDYPLHYQSFSYSPTEALVSCV